MQHTDFLHSLEAIKSHFKKKKTPCTYPSKQSFQNTPCDCKDSNGEFKYLYKTKDELEYMLSCKSVRLKAYPCPYEKGWHLTKSQRRYTHISVSNASQFEYSIVSKM